MLEPAPADWRDAVGRFLVQAPAGVAAAATALGLRFQLRRVLPRTATRWNGPTSEALKRGSPVLAADVRLGVRPVLRTAKGWTTGGVTWSSLPHQQHRLELDPEQQAWFRDFGALHRAAVPPAVGQDSDWAVLDGFGNPLLWRLLDQAVVAGIALVPGASRGSVRVGRSAAVDLDVRRTDGALVASARLSVDDAAVALPRARALGTHGVYAFDPAEPGDLLLAPMAEPLDPQALTLLATLGSDPVAVPERDAAEFLGTTVPALRERIAVVSSDGSAPLPPPAPPRLVVTAAFAPGHVLRLSWAWEAVRGRPPALRDVLPPGVVPDAWLTDDGPGALPGPVVLQGLDAADAATEVLPALERLPGVRVEATGGRPDYRELTGPPSLAITAVPTERPDWFDLGVVVTVDGRRVPFAQLFKALASNRRRILLADGRHLALTHPAFGELKALLEEAMDLPEWQTRPAISRYRTELWSEFEDLADRSEPATEWRGLLAEARGGPTPVASPTGLHAELRPYQAEGLAWLAFLHRHRLGGVLADDMGLGKTLQVLALALHVRERAPGPHPPFLVVAPTSVVSNWAAEAARFTPGLVVRTVPATEGRGPAVAELADGADIVVTSYALLRLDAEAYQAVGRAGGWGTLVLDEAQTVKNAASRIHEVVRDLEAPVKLAVTGTPLENSLTELRAIVDVVAPGLFPSARRFAEEYVRPIEQPAAGITAGAGAGAAPAATAGLRAERLARLRRRIRPFLLRRTKEQVASDLPPKQEQVITVELAPAHRALYDVWLQRERRKLFGLLEDLNRNRFIVFRSITLLRLLALDPALLGEQYADTPGTKQDALLEQLEDVLAEGHKALVFSSFTSYLRIVEARLAAAGVRTAYLDGSTRDRDAAIRDFREGDAQVFLISLKAGGFGLNLTEADYVFLLDPWWNPAEEEQAIDRAHRIGQDKPVLVYRLVAAGTIEEKVMALKARKSAVFDAVLDDDELFASTLTADDLRDLLA